MKSIFKILVLGAVLILGTTAVTDQGLAADRGSQLIFQSNMAHTNFISILNTSDDAVTVLVQYYNNEMEPVVWYLRLLRAGRNLLVNPFNHEIPGTGDAEEGVAATNVYDAIMDSGKAGNGHFVIAVTAVGANTVDDDATTPDEANTLATANILFPTFLAKGLHAMDNIDECGNLAADASTTALSRHPTDKKYDCLTAAAAAEISGVDADTTTRNVGDLNIGNAEPVAFNHLTGHFTEALVGTVAGGTDQTASWGGTPIIRPGVNNTNNAEMKGDYHTLNGADGADAAAAGGRLAEKDAGGTEVENPATVSGFLNIGDNFEEGTTESTTAVDDGDGLISNGTRTYRGIDGGALELPALHGGGAESKQIMLLLSVADDFGDPGAYKLIPAMTGYMVTPMDQMGNALDMEAGPSDPVFGSGAEAESTSVPSAAIIVNGISVMTNANLAKCTGTAIDGPWTLSHLTDLVPEASAGGDKFAGLDAMIDPMMNASPGWVSFTRSALTCKKDYGDGDSANLGEVENPDGVPVTSPRTYMAGTLIVSEKTTNRAFVTTGRALLKFINPMSTFAASWTLKSGPSGADTVN